MKIAFLSANEFTHHHLTMPLDIRLFRDPVTLESIRNSEKKRFSGDDGQSRIDRIVELDAEWKRRLHAMEVAKREKNEASKAIGIKKKAKEVRFCVCSSQRDFIDCLSFRMLLPSCKLRAIREL